MGEGVQRVRLSTTNIGFNGPEFKQGTDKDTGPLSYWPRAYYNDFDDFDVLDPEKHMSICRPQSYMHTLLHKYIALVGKKFDK